MTGVAAAFADELGRPVRPAGVPWGADMRHFTARGIPCTMAGTPGIEEDAFAERLERFARDVMPRFADNPR